MGSESMFGTRFAEPQAFNEALVTAKSMQADESLWWRVLPHGELQPRVDAQSLATILPDEDRRNAFDATLRRELVPLLEAALRDDHSMPHVYAIGRGQDETSISQEETTEAMRRRAAVAATLVTEQLRERTTLRRTSKRGMLNSLAWEISVRHHELANGPVSKIPYATIQLRVAHEPASDEDRLPREMRVIFGKREPETTISFECHAGDVLSLIRDLTTLHTNLTGMRKGGSHE